MRKIFTATVCAVLAAALTACSGAGGGKEYPSESITMIVPYGAGGTTDLVGRQLAIALGKELGQSIVVENTAGASGSIGSQACLDADSDGYTVLFSAESLGTQRVMGISELSYDNFAPIMVTANDPKVIVVAGNSPYNTAEELLADIKAKPGKIQMAYTGPGGSGHIQALIMNECGYEPVLTAYSSGSDGIVAVMGGQVEFTNSNYSTVASYIESGDLKLLAVCANDRMDTYPDVPALSEVMEGSEAYLEIPYSPLSLLVSADVPEEIQNTLREACKKAVQNEDFVKYMDANNIEKLYEKYPAVDEMKTFFREWESTVCWLLEDAGATINSPEKYNIARPN